MDNAHHARIKQINKAHHESLSIHEQIGVFISNWVGTMYCAYLFCLFAFVALPQAISQHSLTVLVNWASSNWAQLVLLPIILVSQNIKEKSNDRKFAEIYKDTEELKTGMKDVAADVKDIKLGINMLQIIKM